MGLKLSVELEKGIKCFQKFAAQLIFLFHISAGRRLFIHHAIFYQLIRLLFIWNNHIVLSVILYLSDQAGITRYRHHPDITTTTRFPIISPWQKRAYQPSANINMVTSPIEQFSESDKTRGDLVCAFASHLAGL